MKILFGGGVESGSGSVGGITTSRNRFGAYQRRKAIPVNPNTSRQVVNRSRFSNGVIAWFGLTAAQRDAWRTYASQVPVTDALGQAINLTGQNMYIRTYSAMLAAGLTPVGDAPTIFNLGDVDATIAIASPAAATQDYNFTYDDTLAWASETGAALFLSMGRPFSFTREFFNGPWRANFTILGDSLTPPSSPASISISTNGGYTMSAGNLMRVKARIIRADGRVSSQFFTANATIA